jgi:branched-chain amino acid transport system substrate-binding protein
MRKFLISILLVFMVTPPLCANLKTLKVGVLLPLSGPLVNQGKAQLAAIKMAQEDINQFFTKINLPQRVALITEDSEGNPKKALAQLKSLRKRDVHLVIGPNTSASVKNCLEYANRARMVLISPSSTTPLLANPRDNLIRLSVSDEGQAEALSQSCENQGITQLVCLTRDDIWGQELHKLIKEKFKEKQGLVFANVFYSPEEKDFSLKIQYLKQLVQDAIHHYGSDKVAIQFSGFDEGVEIFKAAKSDPLLSSIKWFGSDGFAKAPALTNDQEALAFASQVDYESPLFDVMEEQSYLFEHFQERMGDKGFYEVDIYIGNAYDSLWIAGLASLGQNKRGDVKAWKKAIDSAASHNLGITGWAILNENGDRTTGDFVTWKLGSTPTEPPKFVWEENFRFKKSLPVSSSVEDEQMVYRTPQPSYKANQTEFRSATEEISTAKKLENSTQRIRRISDSSTGRFYQ